MNIKLVIESNLQSFFSRVWHLSVLVDRLYWGLYFFFLAVGVIGAGTSVCLDIVCFYPESAHLQKVDSPSMFVGLGSVFQCCTEGACIRTKMHARWAGD